MIEFREGFEEEQDEILAKFKKLIDRMIRRWAIDSKVHYDFLEPLRDALDNKRGLIYNLKEPEHFWDAKDSIMELAYGYRIATVEASIDADGRVSTPDRILADKHCYPYNELDKLSDGANGTMFKVFNQRDAKFYIARHVKLK